MVHAFLHATSNNIIFILTLLLCKQLNCWTFNEDLLCFIATELLAKLDKISKCKQNIFSLSYLHKKSYFALGKEQHSWQTIFFVYFEYFSVYMIT